MKTQLKSHLRATLYHARKSVKILIELVKIQIRGNLYLLNSQNRLYAKKKAEQILKEY
jgi:hypothetical protein